MNPQHQIDAMAQMREVLHADLMALEVVRSQCAEDFAGGTCRLEATVKVSTLDGPIEVVGDGVGVVDAFFGALQARFAPEHPSISSLRFTSFAVRGLLEESGDGAGANAHAKVTIGITNAYGTEFEFTQVTPSVGRSTLQAVADAVSYFVNSERAYVTMYRALEHYRSEGRADLVAKYTRRLAEMVRNTSYSEVIERMAAESSERA